MRPITKLYISSVIKARLFEHHSVTGGARHYMAQAKLQLIVMDDADIQDLAETLASSGRAVRYYVDNYHYEAERIREENPDWIKDLFPEPLLPGQN